MPADGRWDLTRQCSYNIT